MPNDQSTKRLFICEEAFIHNTWCMLFLSIVQMCCAMTILKECHETVHVHTVDFVVYLLFNMYKKDVYSLNTDQIGTKYT